MYLLDSDIAIWILRNNLKIVAKIDELVASGQETALSTATVAEIYKNVLPSEVLNTEDFLNDNVIFDVDLGTGKLGGYYWQQYHKKLANLSIIDCLIAATAKLQNAVLVTLNTKHYPMDDIELLSPTSS